MLATSYLLLLPAIPQVTSDHSIMYQVGEGRVQNQDYLGKIGFTQLYGNLVAWKSILGKSIARMSYHSAQPKRQPLFSSNNSNDILYLYLGVSNVQAGRTWMIYLDRVDKGMES